MKIVINSDEDAINTALQMARDCHYFITGEVRGAGKIKPGHRLACPLVKEPFWIVKLVLEPPPVKSSITIQLSGVSDDLILLVTQEGRVFHWPLSDEDCAAFVSKTYVAESSIWELVPSRSKKVSREEWRQICLDSNREIDRLHEELEQEIRERREREFWIEDAPAEAPSEDAFDLPTLEESEEVFRLIEEKRRSEPGREG